MHIVFFIMFKRPFWYKVTPTLIFKENFNNNNVYVSIMYINIIVTNIIQFFTKSSFSVFLHIIKAFKFNTNKMCTQKLKFIMTYIKH